jgi:mono/diheme cytochrome c family protein
MTRSTSMLLTLAACVALGGCERTFRDMYDQPRYKPLAASTLWADGRASRPPVDGSVPFAAGTFAGSTSGTRGPVEAEPRMPAQASVRDDLRPPVASTDDATFALPPITSQLLARGRERYDVFCSPCHSVAGDGDGYIARRGFPHPPSYHSDRLRAASDAHLYAVITQGYGAMYPYATRIGPADRLAIVAYVRALQLSQHAALDTVPPDARAKLEATR